MKRVLITGGNGDIAKAIGHRLANEGFEVYTPNSLQLDVTDSYGIKLMMELVKPDILINCAGYIKPQALVDLTVEELYNHIDINLIGSIMCAKYAVQNGTTHIINIGSSAGVNPKGGWLAYCVSKSALTMFQKCLEEEGIECLTLHIGRTDTKMRSKLFPNETKELLMSPEDVADAIFCAIRDGKDGVWQLRKRTRDWELIE
jgi:NAD(P)-dependent dehydrogenase (short-subunit alcohol dehydrogenase family)